MHILVVDDDQAVRDSLKRSLQYSGYEVASAADGVEALAHLSTHRVDAVIMDVMMPRLDGLETTRMLRSQGNDVPILVLTARDAVGDRVDAALARVEDPEIHRPITDLGMVKSVDIEGDRVKVAIYLTVSGCPMRDTITQRVTLSVGSVPGVRHVDVRRSARHRPASRSSCPHGRRTRQASQSRATTPYSSRSTGCRIQFPATVAPCPDSGC